MGPSDAVAFLRTKLALFRDAPEDELRALVAAARIATFESNEPIIEFGEEGRFLGVLLDGEAEVSVTDDAGQRHRIAILTAGDFFGEMALLTGDRAVADVTGHTRCRAILFPQALFSTAILALPGAVRTLAKTLADRSRELMEKTGALRLAAAAAARAEDPYGFALRTPEPHRLLVINCGSSSLKFNLYDTADEAGNARGIVERIGGDAMEQTLVTSRGETKRSLGAGTHREAFAAMVEMLTDAKLGVLRAPTDVTLAGHRVVHGGERFQNAEIITDEVLAEIEALSALAPLHNPINALGIREARALFPRIPHIAVFDTAFHHTLPPYAYLYGLPYEYYEEKGVRRYGFHGTSHRYVAMRAASFLERPLNGLEIITCHLGNGASLCAVDHGRSVDTTMGLTPAEGLIMGTRTGDVDPGALVHLIRTEGMDADRMEALINRESGLRGLSGISSDMREIERAAAEGVHRALLAHKTFCYRVRKAIGAYMAAMGGLDALVFTGGIGQGSAVTRSLACQGLGFMGIAVDEERNRAARGFDEICRISPDGSPIEVLVVPTDEERMIAREALRALDRSPIGEIIRERRQAPIPIEVSAHHVHLSREHVEALFGPGHTLTRLSDLSQPGQFACVEQVALVGPKGRVDRVRVLGPERRETQVEISMTEQFKLGIHPPVRQSGDLDGTPGVTIEGSAGSATIEKGVICALRHIHMSPEDALNFGLRDKYRVRVRVEGDRELVFGDVLIRVHPDYRLAMHIDTDEANAAGIATGAIGHIDAIQSRG
ncbi:MAG: acetate/propionate family kinase [Planctomycetes bacterium]|nr:acetate/propionate family kinase [Planctomycetota bacterium]